MLFNSFEFIFLFLPITLALFHFLPPQYRIVTLLVASLVFYSFSGKIHVLILIFVATWSFAWAFIIARNSSRLLFAVATIVPLIPLFVFKYLRFFAAQLGYGPKDFQLIDFATHNVSPAGISFFTFLAIGYLFDVRRKTIAVETNFVRFATFVTFFPHLIAGPILRLREIQSQLIQLPQLGKIRIPHDAVRIFVIGLAYKVFFADILLNIHEKYQVAPSSSAIDGLYSILSYSLVIYYDFWAYSLMALGLGRMFAIELPRNFVQPYLSKNPRDFWRRWHVTLSFCVRDYIYIPLGGSKSYARNIILSFAIVGLWHGAGWNFVVWGLSHAVLVIIYAATKAWWDKLPNAVAIGLTFLLVSLVWPLFYLDLDAFLLLYERILTGSATIELFGLRHWLYLFVVGAYTFTVNEDSIVLSRDRVAIVDWPIVLALIFVCSIAFFTFSREFIYFRF